MHSLEQWLRDRGFAEYAQAFARERIDLDLLPDLTDADLQALGVSTLGERKRLTKAIRLAFGQVSSADERSLVPPGAPVQPEARDRHSHGVPQAERRQLTVMFCDLVGSTALSRRMDPEDLRQLVGEYHQAVMAAVRPVEGYVAQFLGDGVLVYFGFPHAHEDDSERAVHAALAVLQAVATLRTQDGMLRTRIGIATGPVVVGEVGAGSSAAEPAASGETPNLAARLQSCAEPDQIIVSDETRRLLGQTFDLAAMEGLSLKGFDGAIRAWRVVGARKVSTRFEARRSLALSHFVGRDHELSRLLDHWKAALAGDGQALLISGEPGIGKSRLLEAFRSKLGSQGVTTLVWQCSPLSTDSALFPVIQQLDWAAGLIPDDPPERRGDKLRRLSSDLGLAADGIGYLLKLMGLPDGGLVPAGLTPLQESANTLDTLLDAIDGYAARQPVLLLVEDVHWADPTTAELLGLALNRFIDRRVFVLATSREEGLPGVVWPDGQAKMVLKRLDQRDAAVIVQSAAGGKPIPTEVLSRILANTDGIPLFVEELTKSVIDSEVLQETANGYELATAAIDFAIPSTLQDSLMARLDRLALAKEVAQVGAAIGREFGFALLASVLERSEEPLQAALRELSDADLVFRQSDSADANYTFKHALIRDTAYNSMTKQRRRQLHALIARRYEQLYPAIAQDRPDLLAKHLTEGGLMSEAASRWLQAGLKAGSRSANREAAELLRQGIECVNQTPDSDSRDRLTRELTIARAAALNAARGYGADDTFAAFHYASSLTSVQAHLPAYANAVNGLCTSRWVRSDYMNAAAEARNLLSRATSANDPTASGIANRLLAVYGNTVGDYRTAQAHATASLGEDWEQQVAATDLPVGAVHDSSVGAMIHLAISLLQQGRITQARQVERAAVARANASAHPNTVGYCLFWQQFIAFLARDLKALGQLTTAVLDHAETYALPFWSAYGTAFSGFCAHVNGGATPAVARLESVLTRWSAMGNRALITGVYGQLAECLVDAGRPDAAASYLDIALAESKRSGEAWYLPDLLRIQAMLVGALGLPGWQACVERYLTDAVAIARSQGAVLPWTRIEHAYQRHLVATGHPDRAIDRERQIRSEWRSALSDEDLSCVSGVAVGSQGHA